MNVLSSNGNPPYPLFENECNSQYNPYIRPLLLPPISVYIVGFALDLHLERYFATQERAQGCNRLYVTKQGSILEAPIGPADLLRLAYVFLVLDCRFWLLSFTLQVVVQLLNFLLLSLYFEAC